MRRLGPGLALLVAGAALLGPAPAAAQHGLPGAFEGRPLHTRLAAADLVVRARITGETPGRLAVETEASLLGSPPPRFEVKRSPLDPVPLGPGDRAILLLRGARPPYVLVDEPGETIRLADEASAARWSDAVAAALRASDEPVALARVYGEWLDRGPATLRELALAGLASPDLAEAADAVAVERARAAIDPARDATARHTSALVAVRTPAGAAALVEHALATSDPAVVFLALRGGAAHDVAQTEVLLRGALASEDARMRAAGLAALGTFADGLAPASRSLVEAIARDDPELELRTRAEQSLARLERAERRFH